MQSKNNKITNSDILTDSAVIRWFEFYKNLNSKNMAEFLGIKHAAWKDPRNDSRRAVKSNLIVSIKSELKAEN